MWVSCNYVRLCQIKHQHLSMSTVFRQTPSYWDMLPVELKAKIARMVAFPTGDFEVLESHGRLYWSELTYRGRVFYLETSEEVHISASISSSASAWSHPCQIQTQTTKPLFSDWLSVSLQDQQAYKPSKPTGPASLDTLLLTLFYAIWNQRSLSLSFHKGNVSK